MKIGFIGGGNMAGAILSGLIQKGTCTEAEICVSDPSPTVAEKWNAQNITVICDNASLVERSDVVVLAVKPHLYSTVLEEIKGDRCRKPLFLSIAVGKSVSEVKAILGDFARVIRVMPNTPALVGEGMTVLAEPEENVTEADFQTAEAVFQSIGKTEVLPERLLNAVGSVSGSSPAYVFVMIEAMADAAVLDGIPRQTAYKLAAQSVLGSARMVLESGKHPGELKDMVCSPGGTTIEAIKSLEMSGFRGALLQAMGECTRKAERM